MGRYASELAAKATGKCFRTVILMSDAKHAVLAFRRMHHEGRVKICGKKPALVFSRGVADDMEHNTPVFGNSLVGRGSQSKSSAQMRERLFAAELWLSARHSDFVLGDATSNVFLMLLETIAARKRVADLPKLVRWDRESFALTPSSGVRGGSGGGGNNSTAAVTAARCPHFDPVLNECMWISSLGASFQMGWHSVMLNNPWAGAPVRLCIHFQCRLHTQLPFIPLTTIAQ